METLHVQWMDQPGPTDVMSFPMDELRPGREDQEPEAGCSATSCSARRSRRTRRRRPATPPTRSCMLLTTHGILHLLGFDHAEPDEEREMFGSSASILATFSPAAAADR